MHASARMSHLRHDVDEKSWDTTPRDASPLRPFEPALGPRPAVSGITSSLKKFFSRRLRNTYNVGVLMRTRPHQPPLALLDRDTPRFELPPKRPLFFLWSVEDVLRKGLDGRLPSGMEGGTVPLPARSNDRVENVACDIDPPAPLPFLSFPLPSLVYRCLDAPVSDKLLPLPLSSPTDSTVGRVFRFSP